MNTLVSLIAAFGILSGPGGKERLQISNVKILKPSKAQERARILDLGVSVCVLSNCMEKSVLDLKDEITARSKQEIITADASKHLAIVVTGPELDAPDKVVVRRLTKSGNRIHLELSYTSARALGTQLRRNYLWRPLVIVPIDLPAGDYELVVSWEALEKLPDGKQLDLPVVTHERPLKIRASTTENEKRHDVHR